MPSRPRSGSADPPSSSGRSRSPRALARGTSAPFPGTVRYRQGMELQRRAPGEGFSSRSSDSGPRAFVSSTYADLAEYRKHVVQALREAGISVDPMEDWTSSVDEPRHFSTARVVGCDLCVLLIGLRRGHVPEDDVRSITQLEYDQARRLGTDVLVFMLDEDAPWPRRYDELDTDPGMRPWRAELTEAHGVTFFTGDPQSLRIEAALTRWMRECYLMRSPTRVVGTAPPVPSLFVGREDEVAALRDLVMRPHDLRAATGPAYPLIVVRGWPGVGKTTLAAHLAHDETLRQHFRDRVLWASLGPDPLLLEQLRSWARALGQNGQASSVEAMSQELAGALASMSVLLVVDDVWNAAHVRPLRVGGRRSAMLVTTRLNDIADQLAPTPASIYNLAVLSTDKGVELLRQLVPDVVTGDEQACRTLVEDLEGLPLALQVAGVPTPLRSCLAPARGCQSAAQPAAIRCRVDRRVSATRPSPGRRGADGTGLVVPECRDASGGVSGALCLLRCVSAQARDV